MIYYYPLFFTLLFLSLYEKNFNSRTIAIFSVLVFSILVLFAGFRSTEFGDYCSYVYVHLDSPNLLQYLPIIGEYRFHHEYIFSIIFIFFTKIFIDHPIFMFLSTAIVSIGIHFFCFKKMSPYFFLSVLIYFSHNYMFKELAQIRAGVAGSFILLSLYFLANNKNFKHLLLIGTGSLFHLSAIVTYIGYIFYKFNFKKIIFILLMIIAIISTFFLLHLLIFQFLEYFDLLPYRFYVYLNEAGVITKDYDIPPPQMTVNNQDIGIFANLTTVKYFLVSIVSIFLYERLDKAFKYFRVIFSFYFIGLLWIIVFNDFSILATRISSMFTIGEAILIPMFIHIFIPKQLTKIVVCFVAAFIFIYNIHYNIGVPDYPFSFGVDIVESCLEDVPDNAWLNRDLFIK